MTGRLRRLTTLVVTTLVLASGIALVPSAVVAPSSAAPGFNPGYIISDATFYDSGRMSQPQVQTFLQAKGSSCSSANKAVACLKDYTETTTSRAASSVCSAYTGATNQSAAAIIADVARICGVNPQVLLVTLQKEQGLVTTTSPTARKYQIAMGYGCPDGAPCDTQYYGFFNQMYNAASQFQRYRANPTRYGYVAGRTNTIGYHPNAACGSSQVYISNQATAGLYNYTPYQPNAAALATAYGSGDSCSSYGNRNFFSYFSDWFGSPTGQAPIGSFDVLTADGPWITVGGWALDPDTNASIPVHVYVDGVGAANVTASSSRPDVGAIYGRGDAHGFATRVAASDGTHSVCVFAIDATGNPNTLLRCATVTTRSASPAVSLDLAAGADGALRLGGWAMSPHTTNPVRVDVYVDGKGAASAPADKSRPDVGRAFGNGDNHGFDFSIASTPGAHQVCVYAINPYGSTHTQRCAAVTVASATTRGSYDAVSVNGAVVTASGWAMTPHTSASIQVRALVDGVVVATGTAAGSRPDVDRAFANGANHGFDLAFTSAPGTRNVCVEAIDPYTSAARQIGCRTVTVAGLAPRGTLDVVTTAPGTITLIGWAMSPHTPDPIRVDTYVDNVGAHSGLASNPRPDVAAVFNNGTAHGYTTTLTVASGTHSVCQFAIDPFGAAHTLFACRDVVVP